MQFNKPTNLNGLQLKEELAVVGIHIPYVTDTADGFIHFEVEKSKESKAIEIVANHVAIDRSATTAAQRQTVLDRLGLTAEEAALLLS
jgi:hypothetical protein